MTDRVFLSKSHLVRLDSLSGRVSRDIARSRRIDVAHDLESISDLMAQNDVLAAFRTVTFEFRVTEIAVTICPDHHIAQSGVKRCLPVLVRGQCHSREHFSVIVYAEIHLRAADSISVNVFYAHDIVTCLHVVSYHIDFREVRRAADNIFLSVVVSEYAGMHKHCPGSRLVEPGHIQFRFRLAGSEE